MELLKCRSRASLLQSGIGEIPIKVFSTLIWSCWNVDQGLLYFDLDCCNVDLGLLNLNLEFYNVDLGLLYLNLELLKCWSNVFSTSIWSASCKKSKLGARLLNHESFLTSLFLRCVIFIWPFLNWIFIKKSLIDKRFYFWETFDFWNLEVLKLTFKILRFWNFEILKIWNLRFLKLEILKFWNLRFWRFETWNFETWDFEILKLGT